MNTIIEALFIAGLPVALLSFWLFLTAFRDEILTPDASLAAAKDRLAEIKNRGKKSAKDAKKKRRKADPLDKVDRELEKLLPDSDKRSEKTHEAKGIIKKWMDFGGGFYGVMALYTFIVLELGQIWDFINNFTSLADFIARIGVGMIIQQLIEALMNFIYSLIWFVTWLDEVGGLASGSVWLAISYVAYRVGHHYARVGIARRREVWLRAARRIYRRAERAVDEQRARYRNQPEPAEKPADNKD